MERLKILILCIIAFLFLLGTVKICESQENLKDKISAQRGFNEYKEVQETESNPDHFIDKLAELSFESSRVNEKNTIEKNGEKLFLEGKELFNKRKYMESIKKLENEALPTIVKEGNQNKDDINTGITGINIYRCLAVIGSAYLHLASQKRNYTDPIYLNYGISYYENGMKRYKEAIENYLRNYQFIDNIRSRYAEQCFYFALYNEQIKNTDKANHWFGECASMVDQIKNKEFIPKIYAESAINVSVNVQVVADSVDFTWNMHRLLGDEDPLTGDSNQTVMDFMKFYELDPYNYHGQMFTDIWYCVLLFISSDKPYYIKQTSTSLMTKDERHNLDNSFIVVVDYNPDDKWEGFRSQGLLKNDEKVGNSSLVKNANILFSGTHNHILRIYYSIPAEPKVSVPDWQRISASQATGDYEGTVTITITSKRP